MPLLGRKVVHLVKPLTDLQQNETIYTIPHTQEQFRSKAEYEKRLQLYKDEVWTCQCTGHINLNHEEAYRSEQEKYKILKDQFPEYFEKTVLDLVHHSTEILDNLVDHAWTKIQQAFAVGEMVALKVKAQGKSIKGRVMRVDTSMASPQKVDMPNGNCNSPSSDKENSASANAITDQMSAKGDTETSPGKWVHPKLLPYKYSFQPEDEEKIVSGIPAVDLQRVNRTPTKDLVKLFVRGFALRHGTHPNSPWVVSDHLVSKYDLKSKYADFLVSPQKMIELGRKASEEACKKRRASKGETSVAKKPKLDLKSPPKKTPNLNPDGSPRKRGRPRKIDTPQGTPKKQSPKKTVQTPQSGTPRKRGRPRKVDLAVIAKQKEESISSSSDSDSDSSEDVALVNLKLDISSPPGTPRSKQGSPKKRSLADLKRDMEENEPLAALKKSSPKKPPNSDGTPKKRGRPRKYPEVVKIPKKRGRPRKTDAEKSPQKTPKKAMKQMTLFEVKGKGRGRPPKSPGKSPAKSPGRSPKKGPVKLPPMVAKLQKALKVKNNNNKTRHEYNQLLNRVAKALTKREQAVLPADIKDAVMRKIGILDEKKKLDKMTPAQREEYLKKRKEEKKEEVRRKLRLYAMERKKKIEDTDLDLKPLGMPKLVPTPDGIANELFGDIVMITEFINCYKGLLLPEDERVFTAEELMKSMAGGEESFHYMAQLLQVLLQTLLQDGIAEDYKDLGMPLTNLTITPFATSELVRLCLRKTDSDPGSDSEGESDDSSVNDNDDEVPEDLIEHLETTELWSMTPQEKLAAMLALCHRVMGSYSVQDYMVQCQKQASELWRRRVAEGKAKNDRIKEEKQRKKEMKIKQKTQPQKAPSTDTADDKKTGVTIKDFYGKDTPTDEQTEDLATVVKRRRVMSALAAEEKRKKDHEERLRREKEAEEIRKQKDKEAFEKEFLEGIGMAKLVQRQSPIGTDRNHSRYWIFLGAAPGLYVEKGWAPQEIDYRVGPPDDSDLSDLDSDLEDSSEESEGDKKRGRRSMAEIDQSHKRKEKTLPHKGQNLWFVYDNIDDIQTVLKNLHPQGIREHVLKENLQKMITNLEVDIKRAQKEKSEKVTNGVVDKDMREGLTQDLMDMEMRLRSGGLGGVDNFTDWEKNLSKATGIQDFGECLIETRTFISDKFLKGLMALEKKTVSMKEDPEIGEHQDEDEEGNKEAQVRKGEQQWVEAVRSCPTYSRLHVLMGMLDSCIKWERSAENAKCKICRKKGDELLLCDECNQAFHMYCLRPALLSIPEGDWFCPACIPTGQRRAGTRDKDYRRMAEGDSDSEDDSEEGSDEEDEDEMEHEEECAVCGGDEGLVNCATCSLSYHLDCHNPPLYREPRSTWRCNQCKTGTQVSQKRVSQKPARNTYRRPARSKPKKYTYSSSSEEEEEDEEEDDDDSDSATETEELAPPPKRMRTSGQVSPRTGRHSSVNSAIPSMDEQLKAMKEVMSRLMKHRHSWPFHDPVDADEVPDYYDIVKDPINLQDIVDRIQSTSNPYESSQDFVNDIALLFENADLYNKADSDVGHCIQPLEKAFRELLQRYLQDCYYRRDYATAKSGTGLNDHAYSSHS